MFQRTLATDQCVNGKKPPKSGERRN
jgi:hypothetical protein